MFVKPSATTFVLVDCLFQCFENKYRKSIINPFIIQSLLFLELWGIFDITPTLWHFYFDSLYLRNAQLLYIPDFFLHTLDFWKYTYRILNEYFHYYGLCGFLNFNPVVKFEIFIWSKNGQRQLIALTKKPHFSLRRKKMGKIICNWKILEIMKGKKKNNWVKI